MERITRIGLAFAVWLRKHRGHDAKFDRRALRPAICLAPDASTSLSAPALHSGGTSNKSIISLRVNGVKEPSGSAGGGGFGCIARQRRTHSAFVIARPKIGGRPRFGRGSIDCIGITLRPDFIILRSLK